MSHQPLTRKVAYSIIKPSDIEERELLGSGGFGTVYAGHHKEWGDVAIKRIFATTQLPASERKELENEAEKMAKASFRHVVQLYGVIMHPGNYSLVLEYMEYGSLQKFQKDFDNPWAMRKEMIYHVILGMNYLHTEVKIIHSDMKIENVLIGNGFGAKVCDFGLAKWRRLSKKYSRRQKLSNARASGTITHIAPESLRDVNAERTYACDVYSFGITLWEIFTNKIPFDQVDNSTHLSVCVQNMQRPSDSDVPPDCPQFLITMMQKCWHDNPEERPSFGDLKRTVEEKRNELHKTEMIRAKADLLHQIELKNKTATSAGRYVSQPEGETESSVREVTEQMARTTLVSERQSDPIVSQSLSRSVVQDADQSFEHAPITGQKHESETNVKAPFRGSAQAPNQERSENSTEVDSKDSKSSAHPFQETNSPGEHPHEVPEQGLASQGGSASGKGDSGQNIPNPQGNTGQYFPGAQYPPHSGYYPQPHPMMSPFYMPYPGVPQMYPGMPIHPGGTTLLKQGNDGTTIITIGGDTKGVQIGDRNTMYVQPSGKSSKSTSSRTTTSSSRDAPPRRKIKITTSKTPVSFEDIDNISEHIGHEFRSLGRKCGFSNGQLDGFAHDFSTLKEQNYQMLRTWKEYKGSDATREKLANMLCDLKLYDTAAMLPYN